jgi:hypothetical protein
VAGPQRVQDRRSQAAAHLLADRRRSGRRLVTAHLDDDRLDRLARIGVDEIAYRKGRKFLTIVTDHITGPVVWIRQAEAWVYVASGGRVLRTARRPPGACEGRRYSQPERRNMRYSTTAAPSMTSRTAG